MGTPGQLAQGLAAPGHGQLFHQVHHIRQVQVSGLPATEQHHLGGDRGGHIGVAVTVTTHPGDKGDRRNIQRQVLAAAVIERPVKAPEEFGHRPPQGILHHGETPLGFVHRGWALEPEIVPEPYLRYQLTQAHMQALPLALGEALKLQLRQATTDLTVLVDQGAAGDLGRMGSQHQLDAQFTHRVCHCRRGNALRQQFTDTAGKTVGGGQQRIRLTRYIVVLVGDIGEVEKLAEGPRYRHQLLVAQVAQY